MHPIENMLKTTMEEIRDMIDVNTIVGDAVHTQDGTVIMPISKVSFGFVAGGGEYGEGGSTRQPDSDSTDNPFAGGGSAAISLNPMAFLVVKNEDVRLLPMHYNSTVDRLVEMIPQAVSNMKKKMGSQNGKGETQKQQGAGSQQAVKGATITVDDAGELGTGNMESEV